VKQNSVYRAEGRALTKGKILNIFLIGLVFSFIVGIISGLGSAYAPTIDPETFMVVDPGNPGLNMVFSILTFLVGGYATYGMMKVFIAVIKNEPLVLEKALVASVKEQPVKAPLLAFVEGIFLSLWTLLFIIPGIIKSYSYALSTFILVNEPSIDVVAAITKSRQLMDGKKMQLFMLDLSYVGWYILSLFTLGILTVWVGSWHQSARTLFFQDAYQAQR
jgi:uncharacterized membrane protein